MLIAGKHSLNTTRDLLRLQPSSIQDSLALPVDPHSHKSVRDRTRPDDLIAHFEHAVSDDLTVCAMPFGDVADPVARQLRNDHIAEVAITCKWRAPGIDIVELEIAPQKRFE